VVLDPINAGFPQTIATVSLISSIREDIFAAFLLEQRISQTHCNEIKILNESINHIRELRKHELDVLQEKLSYIKFLIFRIV